MVLVQGQLKILKLGLFGKDQTEYSGNHKKEGEDHGFKKKVFIRFDFC